MTTGGKEEVTIDDNDATMSGRKNKNIAGMRRHISIRGKLAVRWKAAA